MSGCQLLSLEWTGQHSFDLTKLIIAILTHLILACLLQYREDTTQQSDVMVHSIFDTLHVILGQDIRYTYWQSTLADAYPCPVKLT